MRAIPWPEAETGADFFCLTASQCRSPDGAERHPGSRRRPRYKLSLESRKSAPVLALGQGIALIPLSSVSLTSRGMARRQGARPGSPGRRWHGLRPGPGREASRPAPCGAPTRHLRLTPQSAIGPRQELFVPGGLFPRPPVGQACVNACPQGAAPDPRLANASGRRPSNLDRDHLHIG